MGHNSYTFLQIMDISAAITPLKGFLTQIDKYLADFYQVKKKGKTKKTLSFRGQSLFYKERMPRIFCYENMVETQNSKQPYMDRKNINDTLNMIWHKKLHFLDWRIITNRLPLDDTIVKYHKNNVNNGFQQQISNPSYHHLCQ